ncbi:MAG: hypothetical protein SVX43_20275 [Cyanobacteriota bacterium]|nr:hypothetical protein [Cyanobacteriota bacterium]
MTFVHWRKISICSATDRLAITTETGRRIIAIAWSAFSRQVRRLRWVRWEE